MLESHTNNDLSASAGLIAGGGLSAGMTRHTHYRVDAFAPLSVDDLIGLAGLRKFKAYERRLMKKAGPRLGRLVVPVSDALKVLKLPETILTPMWVDEFNNLVVSTGLQDSLAKHFQGSAYTAAWYVGLTQGSPTFAAADTMASHSGWVEEQTYDNIAVRATLTLGTPTTATPSTVDNSASKASFTISGTITAGGAFITSSNTRGGSTGTLYGGGAFSQNRSLVDNDVLNVTITLTAGV